MRPDERLSLLKKELEFLDNGGYRNRTQSPGQKERAQMLGPSTSQARLQGPYHTHQPSYRHKRNLNVGEDLRRSVIA
jgi:hypothetical protein